MDSPLLPQFKRNPEGDTTNLLSDLSLSDPLMESDSYLDAAQSSRTGRVYGKDKTQEDELDEETPRKLSEQGAAKPRFSFFPRGQASSTATTSRVMSRGKAEAQHHTEGPTSIHGSEAGDESEGEDQVAEIDGEDEHDHGTTLGQSSVMRRSDSQRDEKLRESLYELRQMNEVFDGVLVAVEASRGHNVRLQNRVRETHELLDRYTALMGQTEHSQRMIMNPKWTGAEDDFAAIEAEEKAKLEAEQAAAAEAERAAEEARLAEERKRHAAQEVTRNKELSSLGRGRGRGGTRVSSRGRGGSGIPAPGSRTLTNTRTTSAASSGVRKPSDGLAGKYANVKSSGYGPSRKVT